MIFNQSNWRDIERYYMSTYVKFAEHGDRLFYINDVSPQEVRGKTEDGDEFVLYLSDAFPFHVDYILPHKAVFQYKGRAVLLQRNPQRQYRRGLSDGNTMLTDVTSGENYSLTFDRLRAFVNKPSYLTLSLYKKRKNDMHSAALSPRFSVGAGSLYVDDIIIGTVDFEKQHINVNKLFVPEITDLLKATAENYTVEGV